MITEFDVKMYNLALVLSLWFINSAQVTYPLYVRMLNLARVQE